jgi:hypothetical protein
VHRGVWVQTWVQELGARSSIIADKKISPRIIRRIVLHHVVTGPGRAFTPDRPLHRIRESGISLQAGRPLASTYNRKAAGCAPVGRQVCVTNGIAPRPESISSWPGPAKAKIGNLKRLARRCEPASSRAVTKQFGSPTKPFLRLGEDVLKPRCACMTSIKQWSSIMWASILNSIYREFLRTTLSGMHKLAVD